MTDQLDTTAIVADAERILTADYPRAVAEHWQRAAQERMAERQRREAELAEAVDAVPDWYVWALCALAVALATVANVAGWL